MYWLKTVTEAGTRAEAQKVVEFYDSRGLTTELITFGRMIVG